MDKFAWNKKQEVIVIRPEDRGIPQSDLNALWKEYLKKSVPIKDAFPNGAIRR